MPDKKKRRRRSCRDRMRKWALEQQRKPSPNPAAKVVAQIALLLSAMAFSMPRPQPVLVTAGPQPRPRKVPVPAVPARPPYTRYDASGWPRRYGGTVPPFSRLLHDIRRPSLIASEDALLVLRTRADPEVQFWLADIIRREAWHELAAVIKPGMTDDDVVTAMLRAAIVWTKQEREKDGKLPSGNGRKTEDEKPTPGSDDDGHKGPK